MHSGYGSGRRDCRVLPITLECTVNSIKAFVLGFLLALVGCGCGDAGELEEFELGTVEQAVSVKPTTFIDGSKRTFGYQGTGEVSCTTDMPAPESCFLPDTKNIRYYFEPGAADFQIAGVYPSRTPKTEMVRAYNILSSPGYLDSSWTFQEVSTVQFGNPNVIIRVGSCGNYGDHLISHFVCLTHRAANPVVNDVLLTESLPGLYYRNKHIMLITVDATRIAANTFDGGREQLFEHGIEAAAVMTTGQGFIPWNPLTPCSDRWWNATCSQRADSFSGTSTDFFEFEPGRLCQANSYNKVQNPTSFSIAAGNCL